MCAHYARVVVPGMVRCATDASSISLQYMMCAQRIASLLFGFARTSHATRWYSLCAWLRTRVLWIFATEIYACARGGARTTLHKYVRNALHFSAQKRASRAHRRGRSSLSYSCTVYVMCVVVTFDAINVGCISSIKKCGANIERRGFCVNGSPTHTFDAYMAQYIIRTGAKIKQIN